jgi:hypothetical protein
MSFILLEGFTRHERHEATQLLADAISTAGWILDHTQLSNKALTLRFELEPNKASLLREALAKLPVTLSPESTQRLEELVGKERLHPERSAPPLQGTFSLTFIHDEPDLKIVVPAVPG